MRFNNRACALMDIPDLPQGAFEHIGDRKIKPQGGGNPISAITDPISDVLGTSGGGGGILGGAEDLVQGAGNVLAESDKFVNREIPGGYILPAALAIAATTGYLDPSLLAGEAAGAAGAAEAAAALEAAAIAEGATTAGMVGAANTGLAAGTATLGAAELAAAEAFGQALPYTEAFDAVNLSKQGLTPSQIGTVLNTGGLDPAVGQYMGELAAQGLSPEAIAQEIANLQLADPSQYIAQDVMQQARSGASIYQGVPSALSAGQAVQAARLGMGLLGQQQQPQRQPQQQMMIGGSQTNPYGSVDYSGLLNLLQPRMASRNSLLG